MPILTKFYRLMVVQLEKREAMAKEAKIMERKKAQKSSKKLRQAATVRDKQSRNNRSGSSGECYALPSQFKCDDLRSLYTLYNFGLAPSFCNKT